jgi:hypothetical protein
MRMMSRLYRPLRALSFAFAIIALGACAAPRAPGAEAQTANDKASARSAPVATPAPAAPQPAQESPAPKKPVRTGGPLPPDAIASGPGQVVIDSSCKTDADCAVKNVGNCCGYYPACVNVNSPTDPKGVQAECAKQGMASVCGFPEISSCNCTQGRCEAAPGGAQVR